MTDLISRQAAIDAAIQAVDEWDGLYPQDRNMRIRNAIYNLPSAQPELIEKTAYIRGFEQGRTQGMIDSRRRKSHSQTCNQTCNQLATDTIQTDLITKIQNGIKATDADDVYSCGVRNGLRWCISLIDDKAPLYENFPSAQEWIPCSERLPEEPDVYLISSESISVTVAFFAGGKWTTPTYLPIIGIDAWMPLPKPWKGDSE